MPTSRLVLALFATLPGVLMDRTERLRLQPRHAAPLLLGCLLACGCGLVFNGRNQCVTVKTTPPGATVTAAGQTTTSPGKIKLHWPDKWPVIRAEQTGYDPACRIVHASMGSGNGLVILLDTQPVTLPTRNLQARVTHSYSTITTKPVPQPGQQLVSWELHIGAFIGFEQSMNWACTLI